MTARSIFITGTDTGVGKTYVTSGLLREFRARGISAAGFKPIECGGRKDSEALREAAGLNGSLDEVNPVWFEEPVAPLAAGKRFRMSDWENIVAKHAELEDRHSWILIEGAGGWMVPITRSLNMADLASELCDEVIIVAANRLGVINHTLLTVAAIRNAGLECRGVILNDGQAIGYGDPLYPLQWPEDRSLTSNARSLRQCLGDVPLFELKGASCFPRLLEDCLLSLE